MKVQLKQVEDNTYVGKGDSNHWVVVDTSAKDDGHDAGTGPMELVLIALAGCTAMDVESILKKKRAPLKKLEVEAAADRAESLPRRFTNIHLTYKIRGDVRQEDAEHAVSLSQEKYCSVAGSLNAMITHEIKIIP